MYRQLSHRDHRLILWSQCQQNQVYRAEISLVKSPIPPSLKGAMGTGNNNYPTGFTRETFDQALSFFIKIKSKTRQPETVKQAFK